MALQDFSNTSAHMIPQLQGGINTIHTFLDITVCKSVLMNIHLPPILNAKCFKLHGKHTYFLINSGYTFELLQDVFINGCNN